MTKFCKKKKKITNLHIMTVLLIYCWCVNNSYYFILNILTTWRTNETMFFKTIASQKNWVIFWAQLSLTSSQLSCVLQSSHPNTPI